MPKLIPIQSTVAIARPGTPTPPGGSPIGTALGVVGQSLQQTVKPLFKIQKENDAIFVAKSLAEMRSSAAQRMIEAREAAPEGGKGFTKQALEAFHTDLNARQEGAPSNRARTILATRAASLRGSIQTQGLGFEVASRLQKKVSDLEVIVREGANAVLTDPSQFDDTKKEIIDSIKEAGLPARIERAQIDAVNTTMTGAFMLATMRDNPAEVLSLLKSGKFDKDITVARKASLMARARAEIKAARDKAVAAAKADAVSRIRDERASTLTTGTRVGLISDDRIVAVFGEKKARPIITMLNENMEIFTLRKRMSLTTLAADQAKLEEKITAATARAKAGEVGFADRMARLQGFARDIQAKGRGQAAAARAEFKTFVTDELNKVRATGKMPGKAFEDRTVAAVGVKQSKKMLDVLREEVEFFAERKALKLSPLGTGAAAVARLQGEAIEGTEGFTAKQSRIQLLAKAVADKRKALTGGDAPKYILENSQEFRDMLQQAREDPRKMAGFSDAILAEQRRLGVPVHLRTIIPKSSAQALVGQIGAEGDPNKRGSMIAGLAINYGDENFSKLMQQLGKNGLPAASAVFGRLTSNEFGVVRRDFAEAIKLGKAGADKLLEKETRDSITAALETETRDFIATAGAQGGGMPMFNREMENLQLLAKYYTVKGDSAGTAAEKAYKALIGDHYTILDRLRIPTKFAGESGTPTADANARKFKGTLLEISANVTDLPIAWDLMPKGDDPRMSEKQRREATRLTLLSSGYWATSSKEDGVILMDEKGMPVMMLPAGPGQQPRPLFVPFEAMKSDAAMRSVLLQRFGVVNSDKLIPSPRGPDEPLSEAERLGLFGPGSPF